jgi:hypothetical protein
MLTATARHALIVHDLGGARRCLHQALTVIDRSGLQELRPVWSLCQAELYVLESKYDAAKAVLAAALKLCESTKMPIVGVEIAIALLQLNTPEKFSFSNSELLSLQKKVRVLGLRKLKAKLLALRALQAHRETNVLNLDFCDQALEVLSKADLSFLRWEFLDVFAECCRREGNEAQAKSFDASRRLIEMRLAGNAKQLHSRVPLLDIIPISIIG